MRGIEGSNWVVNEILRVSVSLRNQPKRAYVGEDGCSFGDLTENIKIDLRCVQMSKLPVLLLVIVPLRSSVCYADLTKIKNPRKVGL
jgi:hypothetical protein